MTDETHAIQGTIHSLNRREMIGVSRCFDIFGYIPWPWDLLC